MARRRMAARSRKENSTQRPLPDLGEWPPLDWEQWKDTAETLHIYMQIVGKIPLRPISVAQFFLGVHQDAADAWRFRKDPSDADGGRECHPLRHRHGSLQLRPRRSYAFLACPPNRGYATQTFFHEFLRQSQPGALLLGIVRPGRHPI